MPISHEKFTAVPRSAPSGLPLPQRAHAPAPRTAPSSFTFFASVVSDRARVSGRSAFNAMGWGTGQAITYAVSRGVILIRSAERPEGHFTVGSLGHIHLPVAVYRPLGILPGDCLLLVPLPERAIVAVIPPGVLEGTLSVGLGDRWAVP
jgi:hypothetical protein